jgi:glycosyltransferase involved in cell wall biosynthesis
MKVFALIQSLKPGGGNRVMLELLQRLQLNSTEIEAMVICSNKAEHINTYGFDNKSIQIIDDVQKSSSLSRLINNFKALSYLRHNYKKGDIIIYSDPIISLLCSFLCKDNMFRFIQADDYRIYDSNALFKNKILLVFYKICTFISYQKKISYIFNSTFTMECFNKLRLFKNYQFTIINPFINPLIFCETIFDKKYEDETVICTFARNNKAKGFSDFLKAINIIQNKGIKIKNVIVSQDNLKDFNLELIENYEIIRPANDFEISKILNYSDIFISTSKREGFGLPAIEAMSCGCAVITSDNRGCMEYAKNQVNCLLYEYGNSEMLALKIENLIYDTGLLSAIKHESSRTIKRYFIDSQSKKFNKFLFKDA